MVWENGGRRALRPDGVLGSLAAAPGRAVRSRPAGGHRPRRRLAFLGADSPPPPCRRSAVGEVRVSLGGTGAPGPLPFG
jgi:hypothetical protein